ncbi:MAG: ATP-binding protein [Elusimicrobiota bacterium]|nr:ATP-binding protein [Elusimicrobiota bacterium]
MLKPNPFTPKSGLEPKAFINREEEINFYFKRVNEAMQGNINHYIINGAWGSGKTSLLRYFKLLAQGQDCSGCYFIARELTENISDMEITAHIIQSIVRNIPYKLAKKNSKLLKLIDAFGIQILGSGFNISFQIDKDKYIDPQIFLADGLLNIWRDISKHTNLLVVLIDDVQNYSKAKRIFTLLKNVLSDKKIIDETKILFILSSTIEGWKPFIQINHPIGRFFIPRMELSNFDREKTIKLIDEVLKDTGVAFTGSVLEKIFKYTEGHLFQTHSLGSALYDNQKNGRVTDDEWDKGLEEAMSYLGNTVYEGISEGISANELKIIRALNLFGNNKLNGISRKVKISGINVYLRRLVDKGILRSLRRGEYEFNDKMLGLYLQNNRNNKE